MNSARDDHDFYNVSALTMHHCVSLCGGTGYKLHVES